MTVYVALPILAVVALAWSGCGRGSHGSITARGPSWTTSAAHQNPSLSASICPVFLTKGDTAARNEPVSAALLRRGYAAGAKESVTVAILGPPSERRAEYNKTYGDTLVELWYPGFEVGFYRGDDGSEILAGLTLTSPHCEVLAGLSVGASATNLSQLLGAPAVQRTVADSLILQFLAERGAVDSYINVVVRQDTIRTIEWQFGID